MSKVHEEYVKPETAKLLREIGFNWEGKLATQNNDGTYQFYPDSETRNWNNKKSVADEYMITCPSLYVAQKFLREKKLIEIHIEFGYKTNQAPYRKEPYYYVKEIWDRNNDEVYQPPHIWVDYSAPPYNQAWGRPKYEIEQDYLEKHLYRDTFEEALDEAIQMSCNHILRPHENVWDFEEKDYIQERIKGTEYDD